ncbi:DUF2807 domain-containing protein [Phototrophicus methaneseepsis]|uniref:DUF2807 domain-containing protein n=1 Tax=Phototrophicus methaneseepsis TaxID=2710758 RepID=A0A7S8IFC7_9CHLR|nr:DUF2807 domain-containing protein [Phototrophicus methaneseepsis]QPC84600.1 DUF2807 domain-containing protein [Phototrophicus methaneseepsis]
MKYNLFMGLIGLAVLLTACNDFTNQIIETIPGSGTVISETREAHDFSRIQVNLGAQLELTQSGEEGITIEADDNLLSYITTEVVNGQLIVSTPHNTRISPSSVIQLHVGFDTLDALEINGSSDVVADDLDLDALTVTFSGSGSTHFTGTVSQQTIIIKGQATINNLDLNSEDVAIDISGNGTIAVQVDETLDIKVAGMGNISYVGDPAVTKQVSGMANINPL